MRQVWRSAVMIVLLSHVPAAATAQQAAPDTVRDAAKRLLGAGFTPQEIDAVATVLALQIATFPVSTSLGGFTLDETGAPVATRSFGSSFVERALTIGRPGSFTLGVSAQATQFESFEGRRLRNGELRSRTIIGSQVVDVDRFTFNVRTQTTTVALNVAVDRHVDLGVIVPLVRTSLTGTSSSLVPFSPQRDERTVDAVAAGLGDVVARAKWNFLERPHGGLAVLIEGYLPTGSEDRLSSAGRWRLRPVFIASAEGGSFSPHVNVGITLGGAGASVRDNAPFLPVIERAEPGREINYSAGADVSPAKDLTVYADIIGRSLRSVVRFEAGEGLLEVPGFGAMPLETFVARQGTLNTRLASIGAKLTVLENGLISAGVLFPLNEGGLKSGVTPVVGFEYQFGVRH